MGCADFSIALLLSGLRVLFFGRKILSVVCNHFKVSDIDEDDADDPHVEDSIEAVVDPHDRVTDKTLFDSDGNQVHFCFNKIYMVSSP